MSKCKQSLFYIIYQVAKFVFLSLQSNVVFTNYDFITVEKHSYSLGSQLESREKYSIQDRQESNEKLEFRCQGQQDVRCSMGERFHQIHSNLLTKYGGSKSSSLTSHSSGKRYHLQYHHRHQHDPQLQKSLQQQCCDHHANVLAKNFPCLLENKDSLHLYI